MIDTQPTKQEPQATSTALTFNPDEFRHLLPEDSRMTKDQQDRFLEALWQVVVGFVDLGFGGTPDQHAMALGRGNTSLADDARLMLGCSQAFNRISKSTSERGKRSGRKKES